MSLQYSSPACSPLNQLRRNLFHAKRRLSEHNGKPTQGSALGMLNIARANLRRYAHHQRGRRTTAPMEVDFITRIAGIPCGVVVTHYDAYHPGNGIDEPPTGGTAEYTITDTQGYAAAWLDKKSTLADHQRIMAECVEYMEQQQ